MVQDIEILLTEYDRAMSETVEIGGDEQEQLCAA